MLAQGSLDGFDDHVFHPRLVLTAYHGTNDQMIANVARLYIRDGATVLDCTYSEGRFWRKTERRFTLIGSDIRPVADVQADFRQLPYRDECADVLVLDPPYVHDVGDRHIEQQYANRATTPRMGYADILALYQAGMAEAMRILRPGGFCWIKCQDQVADKGQAWAVVDMHAAATALGFHPQDMFVLMVTAPPGSQRAERQHHARRNHSYLWIFRKP